MLVSFIDTYYGLKAYLSHMYDGLRASSPKERWRFAWLASVGT